jgi:ABC-type glycerol-3-phosphate transport system substrate-binding protein
MAFMQTEKVQRFVLTNLYQLPVLEKLYKDPDLTQTIPYLQRAETLIKDAIMRPAVPSYNSFSVSLMKEVSEALSHNKTLPAALTDLAAEVKQIGQR